MSANEVEIVPYQDGPYLVRGPVTLRDQAGHPIDPGRRTIALCRCGKSKIRPFCDGTHQLIRFKVSSGPAQVRRDGSQARVWPPSRANGSSQSAPQNGGTRPRSPDEATGRALRLLAAARFLVEHSAATQDGARPEADWATPCVCLVRSAIAALVETAGDGAPEIREVVDQLGALVGRLELSGGHA